MGFDATFAGGGTAELTACMNTKVRLGVVALLVGLLDIRRSADTWERKVSGREKYHFTLIDVVHPSSLAVLLLELRGYSMCNQSRIESRSHQDLNHLILHLGRHPVVQARNDSGILFFLPETQGMIEARVRRTYMALMVKADGLSREGSERAMTTRAERKREICRSCVADTVVTRIWRVV
jgi:hypothetical protein